MSSGASRAEETIAVLLMAHGTPNSLDEMPEYLAHVRGGRPAPPELIEEMRRNYGAIGGRSPLTDITMQQAAALQARLGPSFKVMAGMRNWHPFIKDVVADIGRSRIRRVIGIPLAPQFSSLSVQKYIDAARSALPDGIRFDCVRSYHNHPLLLEAFSQRVRDAAPDRDEEVAFTAHSLPVRVIEAGDSYAREVEETAAGVAVRCNLPEYRLAYQSAGRTSEPWMGPALLELIRGRAALGVRRFLITPIGFVSDHTEILFDIDIQAAEVARACDARIRRIRSLNVSPLFIETLADLVEGMR